MTNRVSFRSMPAHLRHARERLPMGLRRAFGPFLFSRLLLVLIFALVPLVISVPANQWETNGSIAIQLNGHDAEAGLRRIALGNDSAWYLGIARDGYERRRFDTTRQANWAFFPLHPLLWRGMALLTGEWFWSGLILANALTLLGWSLLWSLTHKLTASPACADDAVLFAAFMPSSYFMLLPQTEPLCFALVVLAFLAAYSQRWWLAGVAGMLAGATRFNGVFLFPSLALRWYQGERKLQDLLKLLPIGIGAAAFMVYLWHITGNALAFKDIQGTWDRTPTLPWKPLLGYLKHPLKVATPWNPRLLHFLLAILGLASIVTCWRRRWYGLALFTAVTILAPLATGTLISMSRYVGVAPGVYLALSVWTEQRKRLGQYVVILFAIAMTLLSVCFAAGINLGGA